ncbi:Outer dense fiber protein 3 [Lamellibrachia satsuma]|nr:Outer dense fiber protein 3 [Lamellibrachia satsuma]
MMTQETRHHERTEDYTRDKASQADRGCHNRRGTTGRQSSQLYVTSAQRQTTNFGGRECLIRWLTLGWQSCNYSRTWQTKGTKMAYNYTKPRRPIAAMCTTPGPCYALPSLMGQTRHDPRSIHTKGPAYGFGIKHGNFSDDCSPGPCYFPDSKVYRDGRDGTPHYTACGRQKELSSFNVPGPGRYFPEKSGPSASYREPHYTFGMKHRNLKLDNMPAPNVYTLPRMLGPVVVGDKIQAPCYSLVGRSKVGGLSDDIQKTPGPGTYEVTDQKVYKMRNPAYSLTSRNNPPGDTTMKPGPGAHSPEKVWKHKTEAPHFSFGIHHSQYTAPLIVDVDKDDCKGQYQAVI